MADAGDDASSTGSNEVAVTEDEIQCVLLLYRLLGFISLLRFASSALLAVFVFDLVMFSAPAAAIGLNFFWVSMSCVSSSSHC